MSCGGDRAKRFNERERRAGRLTPAMVAYILQLGNTAVLEDAACAFQKAAGLKVDGWLGEKSQDALLKAMRPTVPIPDIGPRGIGFYARGNVLDNAELVDQAHVIGAKHVWIQLAHVNRGAPKALNDAGLDWGIFSTPKGDGNPRTADSWVPSEYPRTIANFMAILLGEGGKYLGADTENDWPGVPRPMMVKLGYDLLDCALELAERGVDVLMTTFLSHPLRRVLAPICGHIVVCSTQLYEDRPADANADHLADERDYGWLVSCPSWGAYLHYDTTPNQPGGWKARARTAQEFRAAYDDFPTVRGSIIWPVGDIRGPLAAEVKRLSTRAWA